MMVIGPVNMPLTGRLVRACATLNSRIVIGAERLMVSWMMGGRTYRLPYDCTQPCCVNQNPSMHCPKNSTLHVHTSSVHSMAEEIPITGFAKLAALI